MQTFTYDLRPSWRRHPITRLRWWRQDRRHARWLKSLSAEQRTAYEQINDRMDRLFLLGPEDAR